MTENTEYLLKPIEPGSDDNEPKLGIEVTSKKSLDTIPPDVGTPGVDVTNKEDRKGSGWR